MLHLIFVDGLMMIRTTRRQTARANCPPRARASIDNMLDNGGVLDVTGMWSKSTGEDLRAQLYIQREVATKCPTIYDSLQNLDATPAAGKASGATKKRKTTPRIQTETARRGKTVVCEVGILPEGSDKPTKTCKMEVTFTSSHEIVHGNVPSQHVHGHSIFGCPGMYGRSAQERARDAETALTVRANTGYYMGRLTNESPTSWVLTPSEQGEEYASGDTNHPLGTYASTTDQRNEGAGRKWCIINVSYTKCQWLERGYANEARLMPPDGGPREGDVIKMFEASNLSSIKPRRLSRKPGAPRGRPVGWRKDSGLTYEQTRQRNAQTKDDASHEPQEEMPSVGGTSTMQPTTSEVDIYEPSDSDDDDDEPPPLISESESSDDSSSDEDDHDEANHSVDDNSSAEEEAAEFGAGRYPTRRRRQDQKFGQPPPRKRTTERLFHFSAKNIAEAEIATQVAMNSMASGVPEEEIDHHLDLLSRHDQSIEATLDVQRGWQDQARQRERSSEVTEFLCTLASSQGPQPEGQATTDAEVAEKLRKAEENGEAIDSELRKALVSARPIDQGGHTLSDAEILALPHVRNVADAFVSPIAYKIWEANKTEKNAWDDTQTATWVRTSDVPPHVRPIDIVFVAHAKPNTDGGVNKVKARWPLGGQDLYENVHYSGSSFASTPSAQDVRAWMAIAAGDLDKFGEPPTKADVRGAFLETDVDPVFGSVFARVPGAMAMAEMTLDEFHCERQRLLYLKENDPRAFKQARAAWRTCHHGWCLQMNSRVYGDPSASAAFFQMIRKLFMEELGFARNTVAPCLYTIKQPLREVLSKIEDAEVRAGLEEKMQAGLPWTLGEHGAEPQGTLMVLQHVDDFAISGDPVSKAWLHQEMSRRVTLSEWDPMENFVGIRVKIDMANATICLDQSALIEAAWQKYGGMVKEANLEGKTTPAEEGLDLKSRPTVEDHAECKDLPLPNLVGAIGYAVNWTRPEAMNALRQLSRHLLSFGKQEWNAALWLMSFMHNTKDDGIWFSGRKPTEGKMQLWGNADASFGLRCYMGIIVYLMGGPVDYYCGRIESNQSSTASAELAAQNKAGRMILGLHNLITDPAMPETWQRAPPPILQCDNKTCVKICTTFGFMSALTKFMERQALAVREWICKGLLLMIWLPTAVMPSDPLTKNLGRNKFNIHKPEMTGEACAKANVLNNIIEAYLPYPGISRKEKEPNKQRKIAYLRAQEAKLLRQTNQCYALRSVAPWSPHEQALVNLQRLGFPPIEIAEKMAKHETLGGLVFPKKAVMDQAFLPKVQGRFRKQASKREDDWQRPSQWQPLFYLVCDMLELAVPGPDGCRFAYVFYDAKCSRYRMVYPVQRKTLYWRALQQAILRARSYGWTVGVVKTDGAKEMTSEAAHEIMDLYGVRALESSPYTPQENGAAESAIREVKDCARTLMANAKHLPEECGMLAIIHAANLLNTRGFNFRMRE